MFEDNVLESDELALENPESPRSVPGSRPEPNQKSLKEEPRVVSRQKRPAPRQPASPEPEAPPPPPTDADKISWEQESLDLESF